MDLNFIKKYTDETLNISSYYSVSILNEQKCIQTDGFVYELDCSAYDDKHRIIYDKLKRIINKKKPLCQCDMENPIVPCYYHSPTKENIQNIFPLYKKSYIMQKNSKKIIEHNLPRNIRPIHIDFKSFYDGRITLKDGFLSKVYPTIFNDDNSIDFELGMLLQEEEDFIERKNVRFGKSISLKNLIGDLMVEPYVLYNKSQKSPNCYVIPNCYTIPNRYDETPNRYAIPSNLFLWGDLKFNRLSHKKEINADFNSIYINHSDLECSYLLSNARDIIIEYNECDKNTNFHILYGNAVQITIYYIEMDPQIYTEIQNALTQQFEEKGYMLLDYDRRFYLYQKETTDINTTLEKIYKEINALK